MAKLHNRRSAPVTIAVAVALLAAACGGSSASGDGGTANGGGSTDGEGRSDQPERVYVEAISGDPGGLNPQFAGGPIVTRTTFTVFESLVEITDEYEIIPALAHDWEFSDDGSSVTFHLEEGVTWHDGEPFTAADVVFNFDEVMTYQSFGNALAATIGDVEAPDDHTVVVELESEYGPFLEVLSQQAIIPKHLYEGTDFLTNPYNMEPIGTGPMMFEEFKPGDELVLVRNPDWWRGETQVDKTIFTVMTDANSRGLAMLNGELDGAVLDPMQQSDVAAHPDLVQTDRGFFQEMITLTLNAEQPELQDPAVRALVFAAIDREAVVRLSLSGLGEPAESFFPDSLGWANHPDIRFSDAYPRDIEAIKAGLDAAGYPVGDNGSRFAIDARFVSTHAEAASTAEVIQASLAEVDIQVNLTGAAQPVWQEAVYTEGDFGMSILRNTAGVDPSIGFSRWLVCNPERRALNNGSGICDEELDAAANAAVTTLRREERAPHFHDLQERARDLIYWAPLVWTNASNQTVNISRWKNADQITGRTNSIPWLAMEWNGD